MLIKTDDKTIKLNLPLYMDDVVDAIKNLETRKQKKEFLTFLRDNIKGLSKVIEVLYNGRPKPFNKDEVKGLEGSFDEGNFPGHSIKLLIPFINSPEFQIMMKRDEKQEYEIVLSSFTETEFKLLLNYLKGKKLKLNGVTDKLLAEVFGLGKDIS